MSTTETSPTSNPPAAEVPLPAPDTAEVVNAEATEAVAIAVAEEPTPPAPEAEETTPEAAPAKETEPEVAPTKEAEAAPAAEEPEPENALTKKFTAKEWEALKAFRVRLLPPSPPPSPHLRSRLTGIGHAGHASGYLCECV